VYYDQTSYDARLEWGTEGLRRLVRPSEVVVVVDVLTFSTAVDVAVARGALVFPCRWRDHRAESLAREAGADLAVGRGQVDPAHPYSLSPVTLRALTPGARLVLPSPNGATLAALAAETGATVLTGCLRNAGAVARAARALGDTLTVIAAGERWNGGDGSLRPAAEDLIGAGAILAAWEPRAPSPEARIAIAAFQAAAPTLGHFLTECTSARELDEQGFARDVAIAAGVNVSETAPLLSGGAFTTADRDQT
jgi:2-phosphosulfolactate phosphatase